MIRLDSKRLLAVTAAVSLMLSSTACSTLAKRKKEARYAPTESIIEVVSVLRRHVPYDTYKFQPGRDFSGRNVYRASLIRLENLERLHAGALAAGHLEEIIAFSKGRSLERLRAYDLAAQHFLAARKNPTLREAAEQSASINEAIAEAIAIGIGLDAPLDSSAMLPLDHMRVVGDLDLRVSRLTGLLTKSPPAPYPAIIREEIERADVQRARYFTSMRNVLEEGNLRAVAEWQRTISRHSPSKLRHRHLIAAADLFSSLAHDYVMAKPPESLEFDPPMFREFVDGATQLYEAVAVKDGAPEKLEASRRLEAFLAFTLQVDSERFSY